MFLLVQCDPPTLMQSPWPQGTECVAKYNFKGTTEQDLPFNKGDILTIIIVTKVNHCSSDVGLF